MESGEYDVARYCYYTIVINTCLSNNNEKSCFAKLTKSLYCYCHTNGLQFCHPDVHLPKGK